jgi:hypothetical protein
MTIHKSRVRAPWDRRILRTKVVIAAVAILLAFVSTAPAVTIAWSQVGNPGNAADQNFLGQGAFGAVSYSNNIDNYDVTNSQYLEFLNAKDATGADTRANSFTHFRPVGSGISS